MSPVCHPVDVQNGSRREQFAYFSAMRNPYVGVTCAVDITRFRQAITKLGHPFFLSFLWCVAGAANDVPELRRRIQNGGAVEYDVCPTSHTVAREDGGYGYCELLCNQPFDDFLTYATPLHERAKHASDLNESDPLPLIFVSCVPWMSYTAIVQPTPDPPDSNPRVTWGRYDRQGGRLMLPVTLLCHHALVDGLHLSFFYQALNERLNAF